MVQQVIRKYVIVGVAVAVLTALIWAVMGTPRLTGRPYLFVVGMWLLLVSGIGRIGWKAQTWGGHSRAEQVDGVLFVILAGLGSALLLAEYFLALRS
jgi:hypothetical protein